MRQKLKQIDWEKLTFHEHLLFIHKNLPEAGPKNVLRLAFRHLSEENKTYASKNEKISRNHLDFDLKKLLLQKKFEIFDLFFGKSLMFYK